MKNFWPHILAIPARLRSKVGSWRGPDKSFILPFLFAFFLMLTFIEATLARNQAIRLFKKGFSDLTSCLNEAQMDIAYDRIRFSNLFFKPLVEIDNLQLYNLRGKELWKLSFAQISGDPGLLNTNKLLLRPSGEIGLAYGVKHHPVSGKILLNITGADGGLEKLQADFDALNIKDFAKIGSIRTQIRRMPAFANEALIAPSYETSLEIRDVKLNGLLKYPLTSEIRRLYLHAALMGQISLKDSLWLEMENWLRNGGFIDIQRLVVNWEPMVLVGRGTVNFNEKLSPRINLMTSSKALLRLIDDLQKNGFLERKGVFVADILLKSKGFKLHEEDKHLTLTTPINYQDGKLSVENITVKNF